jgi:hypothetical protein
MKYEQKSFTIGPSLAPEPTPLCPRCAHSVPAATRIRWKLCAAHREQLPT